MGRRNYGLPRRREEPRQKRQWQPPRADRHWALKALLLVIVAIGFGLGKLLESTIGQILIGIVLVVLAAWWGGTYILATYGVFFGWAIIIGGGIVLFLLLLFVLIPLLDAIT